MKRYVAILILMFTTALSALAQFQKLDLPEDVTYNDVYFSTPSTGFILGSKGTFLKTTDTGATWQRIEMDTTVFLLKAHFPTPEIGFIMAGTTAEARVLKTMDGGETWNVINNMIRGEKIYFTSPEIGFIYSEGSLWKTINGGKTWMWKGQTIFCDMRDLMFVTPTVGYTVGAYCMQKTIDGGETWQTVDSTAKGLTRWSIIEACWFRNADTGIIVGQYNPLLAKTYDGAKTWISELASHQIDDGSYVRGLYGLHFPNKNLGYSVGGEPTLYKTLDGGETWKGIRFDISIGNAFQKVHFANEKIGFMISLNGKQVVRITNGGEATVGVNDDEKITSLEEFLSFPQPAYNTFTIKLPTRFNISAYKIYDVDGRIVNNCFLLNISNDQLIVVNISAPQGKYFYTLYDKMNHTASNGSFVLTP